MKLIDIEAVLKAAELAGKEYVSIDFLKDFEQVDAVPVVRCGECRISKPSSFGDGWIYCQNNKLHHQKSHFCSYGEKMEDKP